MPTLAGMRRRGYTPESIKDFCGRVGITKKNKIIEMGVLENAVREDLNNRAERAMAVLRPLKVVLINWPEGKTEMLPAQNHPNDPDMGSREIQFGGEIFVEQDDFMEDPPRKFFRLRPGGEVRLRYGYIIKCEEVVKDDEGNVVELRCSYDPETRSGEAAAQRKVKGTIHWVSAADSVQAEVRLYDRLFSVARPDQGGADDSFESYLNPDSLEVISDARIEPGLADKSGKALQFERTGYFVTDAVDSTPANPVFNRIVTLRDSWAKIEKEQLGENQDNS
jgi:glutaminyl-tRNA synthetase